MLNVLLLLSPLLTALGTARHITQPDLGDQLVLAPLDANATYTPRPLRFAVFGDSWASGLNHGPPNPDVEYDFPNDEEVCRCRRVNEAWPVQLLRDGGEWAQKFTLELDYQACHGAGFGSIADQVRRLDQSHTPDVGFLIIGGNDGGFPGIIENCVGQFDMGKDYGPEYPDSGGSCYQTLQNARALVNSNTFIQGLLGSIHAILDEPRLRRNPNFRLFVVSYSGLFNHDDPACDDMTFGVWGGKQPKLTRQLRYAINSVIDEGRRMYDLQINHYLGDRRVKYLDANAVLGGHRFCEPTPDGTMQQMYDRAWLYHMDWPECIPLAQRHDSEAWGFPSAHIEGFCRKCGGWAELGDIQRPFHPTPAGHKAYKDFLVNILATEMPN